MLGSKRKNIDLKNTSGFSLKEPNASFKAAVVSGLPHSVSNAFRSPRIAYAESFLWQTRGMMTVRAIFFVDWYGQFCRINAAVPACAFV